MLIILLVAAGAYLALEDLVGSMDIQSFFDDTEAQQNEEIAASQQQAFDGYSFLEDNEKQAYARVVGMLDGFWYRSKGKWGQHGRNWAGPGGHWLRLSGNILGRRIFLAILTKAIRKSAR